MKKTSLLLVVALLTTGCSILQEEIAPKVADAVRTYCQEPQGARELIREAVNTELAEDGHTVRVTCAGDAVGYLDSDDVQPQLVITDVAGTRRGYDVSDSQALQWTIWCQEDPNCTVIYAANEKGRPKPPH